MIPRIEDAIIENLERRICAAIPETAPGEGDEPETFVTTIETRKFTTSVQGQGNITIYGEVEAEISVILYSQKRCYDYSALLADFAANPCMSIFGVPVWLTIDRCEAVEGQHLTNDGWGFKARYYIFEVEDGADWRQPNVGAEFASEYDIYPEPRPYLPHEPEAHF